LRRRLNWYGSLFPKIEIEPARSKGFELGSHCLKAFWRSNISRISVCRKDERRVLSGESEKNVDLLVSNRHRCSAKTGVMRLGG
jgi:hypothetical protein